MCKLAIFPYLTAKTNKKAKIFAKLLGNIYVETEQDGFGYAAVDVEDRLFGERWLEPHLIFKKFKSSVPENWKDFSIEGNSYEKFGEGELSQQVKSLMIHARLATSEVAIYNVHPFIDDGTALIHNGVINKKGMKLKTSTCDSEGALNEYNESVVGSFPEQAQDFISTLSGWFALGIYAKSLDKSYILDVIKDASASLYIIRLDKEFDVFVTSLEDARRAARRGGMKITSHAQVISNIFMRFNINTGEIIVLDKFNTKRVFGYENYISEWQKTATHPWTENEDDDMKDILLDTKNERIKYGL